MLGFSVQKSVFFNTRPFCS